MTSDEAREVFNEAHDGELDAAARAAFDAALGADESLAKEYAEFESLLRTVAVPDDDAPDLLVGVQRKLHARSRGRFYRDRFAQRSGLGLTMPLVLAVVMLVLLAAAWIALQLFEPDAPSPSPRRPATTSTTTR